MMTNRLKVSSNPLKLKEAWALKVFIHSHSTNTHSSLRNSSGHSSLTWMRVGVIPWVRYHRAWVRFSTHSTNRVKKVFHNLQWCSSCIRIRRRKTRSRTILLMAALRLLVSKLLLIWSQLTKTPPLPIHQHLKLMISIKVGKRTPSLACQSI